MPAASESADRHRAVWTLVEKGSFKLLGKAAPQDFDFRSLHPERKITVLQALLNGIVTHAKEPFLETATFLVRRGADPFQRAPAGTQTFGKWSYDKEKGEVAKSFQYAKKSAVDLVFEMKDEFHSLIKAKKGPWQGCADKMDSLIKIFEEHVSGESSDDRVLVADATVGHWESIMEDQESCDITLKCAEDNIVVCHSFMLKRASPVVSAMLEVGMAEKESKSIDVSDVTAGSAKLLLEICYCGCVHEAERGWKVVLDCLDLAHRWQVDFAVRMLEKMLLPKVAAASFKDLCEAASLKELAILKPALREFGRTNNVIKEQFEKAELPEVCFPYVEAASKPSAAEPAKKKRRCSY